MRTISGLQACLSTELTSPGRILSEARLLHSSWVQAVCSMCVRVITLRHVEIQSASVCWYCNLSLQESDVLTTLQSWYENELCNSLTTILSFKECNSLVSDVMTHTVTQYYSMKPTQSNWGDSQCLLIHTCLLKKYNNNSQLTLKLPCSTCRNTKTTFTHFPVGLMLSNICSC